MHRVFFLVAVFTLFMPVGGGAATAPITINSCQPILHNNRFDTPAPNTLSGILQPSTSNGMQIQFTNETNKVANLINFDVRSNGVQFVIRDVGTFSPGVTINHNYRNGAGQAFVLPAFIPPHVKCHISLVRFTDGTTWPAKDDVAPTTALRANPSSVTMTMDTDSTLVMVSTTGSVGGFSEKNDCSRIAAISVATTSQASAVYVIRPIAKGTCTFHVSDASRTIDVPVTIQ